MRLGFLVNDIMTSSLR